MATRTYAVESVVYRIGGLLDASLALAEDASSPVAIRASLEEYAVECSLAKVLASEELGFVVDELVQVHGGYGYIDAYPAATAYRDARIHRIWEGTNEVNRLLVPGTLLKRAMAGRLDLLGPARRAQEALLGGELPTFEGPLAGEEAAVAAVRTVTLLLAGAAVQRYGTGLEQEQELLVGIADMAIDLFAMESAVARARAASDPIHHDLARLVVAERAGSSEQRAKGLAASLAEGDEARTLVAGIRRLLRTRAGRPDRDRPARRRRGDRANGLSSLRSAGQRREDVATMSTVLAAADPERPWVAHYEPGVAADVEIPALTLDGILRRTAQQTPDHTALNFLGARTSYAELDRAVDRFAHVLRGMGVEKGDRVSLHLPTTPAFVIALMGAMRAGAAAVPMNPLYVERELAILFADTTPRVSVAMDLLVPRMRKVAADGGGRPGRLVVTGIQDSLPVPIRWLYPIKARREGRWHPQPHNDETPNLFRLLREAPDGAVESAAKPDDVAVLQPTGGTTGTPKAAMLTHRNLVANAVPGRGVVPHGRQRRTADPALPVAAVPHLRAHGRPELRDAHRRDADPPAALRPQAGAQGRAQVPPTALSRGADDVPDARPLPGRRQVRPLEHRCLHQRRRAAGARRYSTPSRRSPAGGCARATA